jgi:ubiquinone/menaquinone biosynthesis C-methylase UbiE
MMKLNEMTKFKFNKITCPWWFLFTFDNPLRRILQDPEKILEPYVKSGDIAVDIGCGMGYFSIPLARLVGTSGQVIAVDLQKQMLAGLTKRAKQAGLLDRIEIHQCSQTQLGIQSQVDFVLAFWMVHEVHQLRPFLQQIYKLLKGNGQLLIAEPFIHVSENDFKLLVKELEAIGFAIDQQPNIWFSRSILACK